MKRFVLSSLLLLAALGCSRKDPRTTVRLLIGPDPDRAWAEIVQKFEAANPGQHVEVIKGPWAPNEREGRYITSFQSGEAGYDLVYMDVIWVAKFAAQGWLLPLDDRFPKERWADFMSADIQGSIYAGHIYRVPVQSDAGLIYYRTDMLAKAPETFEDLQALAARHGTSAYLFQGKQTEALVCNFLEVLWGHGGDVLDDKGGVILDRPEAVRALEWMKSTVGILSPKAVTTYEEEETRKEFQEGRTAVLRNWPYVWTLAQGEGSKITGKIGIAPMVHLPGLQGTGTLGGWGFGIARNAKNPDGAWKFVDFVTQPASLKTLHFKSGIIPARRALFEDKDILEKSPHYPQLYTILQQARPRPVHPKYAQISDVIRSAVSSTLAGEIPPEAALRKAAQNIRSLLTP